MSKPSNMHPYAATSTHLIHALASPQLQILDPPTQPIDALLELPHVPPHERLVLAEALLDALDRARELLERRARAPLLVLEPCERALEAGGGRVERSERAEAREHVRDVREQRREAREDGRELLLQRRGRRGGRAGAWGRGGRGGGGGVVRARAPRGAVVRLAAPARA